MKLQIIIWSCVSSYINLFVGLKTPISKFIDIGGSFAGVFIWVSYKSNVMSVQNSAKLRNKKQSWQISNVLFISYVTTWNYSALVYPAIHFTVPRFSLEIKMEAAVRWKPKLSVCLDW